MASPLARLLFPQQAENTIDLEPSREKKVVHTARAGRRRPLSVFGTLQSRSLCGSDPSRRPRPLRASHDHLVGSLSLWTKLRAHSGCVNTISWCADDPSLLASGSDDTRVLVWRVPPRISADEPLRPASTIDTGHTHNIFGVVFVPRTPGEVVTCAADGEVRHHDLEAQRSKLLLPTPGGGGGAFSDAPMAFKLAFLPGQPHALLCSYQDGAVRLLDLRVAAASRSADVVAQLGAGVLATSFAFHPAAPTMYALGADPDPLVRLLDLRRPSTTTADAALCFAPSHALAELSQIGGVVGRRRLPDRRRLRSPLQRRDVEPLRDGEPLRRRRARSFENDRVLDGPGARIHGSVIVAAVEQQPHRISIFISGELGSFVFHLAIVVARIFCRIGVPLQRLPDAVPRFEGPSILPLRIRAVLGRKDRGDTVARVPAQLHPVQGVGRVLLGVVLGFKPFVLCCPARVLVPSGP